MNFREDRASGDVSQITFYGNGKGYLEYGRTNLMEKPVLIYQQGAISKNLTKSLSWPTIFTILWRAF